MSNKCAISGSIRQVGNRVSHAKNRTKHAFKANLQDKKLYISSKKAFVKVKLSTRVIRTIDKYGLDATLKKYGLTLKDLEV